MGIDTQFRLLEFWDILSFMDDMKEVQSAL